MKRKKRSKEVGLGSWEKLLRMAQSGDPVLAERAKLLIEQMERMEEEKPGRKKKPKSG